jgi:aminopeptidase-like protein
VAVGTEVMKRLGKEFSETNYSYQLLVMPETIGSSVFLAENDELIDSYLGSVFIEMPGIDSPITLKATRKGTTYLDRVLKHVTQELGLEHSECSFREQWGNDELVFDSPGVGIPGAAILRYPFHWYHTSGDDLASTNPDRLEEIVEILMSAIRLIESDFVPLQRQRVPVYLTRFNLYADAILERDAYAQNSAVLDLLWEGMSVFDISQQIGAPYSEVKEFVGKLMENDLVERIPLTPQYFRESVITPKN